LAAYDVRRRVTRGGDGGIHFYWGSVGVEMSQAEFLDFASMVAGARECPARCGELARGWGGRVCRCAMGQISLHHGNVTLWFSPEEFEDLCGLTAAARQRLADSEPLPALGVSWTPRRESFSAN
jgi:hypothetical protein